MWIDWYKLLPKNKIMLYLFFMESIQTVLQLSNILIASKVQDSIYKVTTASSLIHQRLLNWGIPKSKLEIIPIGVDTNLFNIPKYEKNLG